MSGCTVPPPEPEQPVVPVVVAAPAVPVAPVESVVTKTESVAAPQRIVILLSGDNASYTEISAQIEKLGAEHQFLQLNLEQRRTISPGMRKLIEQFDPDRIIAIGLNAAKAGRSFADIPMVFCQVFNFENHALLSSTSSGVNFLPPFTLQFELLKEIIPELARAGIILGAGQEALIEEIRNASAAHEVELLVRTASTDKEALFEFKRLAPNIQGFLLLPDNRILSPGVLREIVAYGKKHATQMVVFSPELLKLGADISFSSSSHDIAGSVLRSIEIASDPGSKRPSSMTALTTLEADLNPEVAAALRPETVEKLSRFSAQP